MVFPFKKESMGSEDGSSHARKALGILGATAAIGLVLANMNSIFGLLSAVYPIGSSGVVSSANINVYWESGCINNVTSINWGTLSPGQSKNVVVYVKNTGTVALTLALSTDGWSPAGAATYLALTWNYGGVQIQPNQVLAVTLTLTVSESIEGITDFSFTIYIAGTQGT